MTTRTFRIGIWVLAAMTIFNLVLHASGLFAIAHDEDERLVFSSLTALNALGLVVALVPLRAGERWAWLASWIQVLATAAVLPIGLASGDKTAMPYGYLGFAVVMAVGLLLARPAGDDLPGRAQTA
ncbi:hypothetical protein [Aeromicrobium sp.]|uniref:hypothetical protein n=1 Tax=Aeromicrobium sp. TaxID=1871063 RepID=UPI003D6C4315